MELESRIESLDGVLRDWGYDDVDNWWRDGEEAVEDEDEGPHQPGSSNRVTEEEPDSNTVRRTTTGAPATTDVKSDDITVVAAYVASRAAVLHVSLMAKAHDNNKLVVPAFFSSGEMANWQIALGLACVCSGGFSDELEVAWLSERSSNTCLWIGTQKRLN